MRQILIKKSDALRANPSNPTELELLAAETIVLKESGPTPVTLYGALQAVSGTPKFRFSVPEDLARKGVFLLGAYVESGVVTAYFSVIQGGGSVTVIKGDALLIAESTTFDSLTLVDGDVRFRGGVLMLDPQDVPAAGKKKPRKKRKS